MAKCGLSISLDRMEKILGYKVACLDDAYNDKQRFCSNLTAVSFGVYERTRNKLDECSRTKRHNYFATALESLHLGPGVSHVRVIVHLLLSTLPSGDSKNNPGFRNLHDRIDQVDIPDQSGEPADRHGFGRWNSPGLCQLYAPAQTD